MKRYESSGMKDTRSGFGAGLYELGQENENVIALCADLSGSLKMGDFIKAFPEYEEFYNSCRLSTTKTQRAIRLEQRRAEMMRRKQNDKVD